MRRLETIPSHETDEFEPNIAVTHDRFVVPAPQSDGLEVYSFDALYEEHSVAFVGLSFPPIQALATSAPNGVLLTFLEGAQIRSAFHRPGETGIALEPLPNNGQTTCCTFRAWHAGRYQNGNFGVMWKPHASYPQNEFAGVTGDGVPDENTFTVQDMPVPSFAGPIGDTLVLSDCDRAIMFTEQAYPEATSDIDAGTEACAVGFNGTSGRVAELNGGTMLWRSVFSGIEPPAVLLDWPADAPSEIAMAWDGSGYGVVWKSGSDLHYARVQICQ